MKITLPLLLLTLGLVVQAQADGPPQLATNTGSENASLAIETAPSGTSWPLATADLKADPRAVWGHLDNGLRYVILPNREAPGRASLQMYMDVGSLMEQDNQQGVAHFLEHMAFNGTKHFAAGDTFEYFQRLGMSFGAHTNAATYFDKTIYQLELPRANEELTGDGLKLFRDFLDGMLLEDKEIERERGVILSEILARNTIAYRAAVVSLQCTFPDSLVSHRMPLGTVESVRALKRQQFVDFYETWYTPGRAVIVAVGDFDVNMVERLIKQNFQDANARRGEQPNPSIGKVSQSSSSTAKLHSDLDAQDVSVMLGIVRPNAEVVDSVDLRRHDIVRQLANSMLNARFRKLAAAEGATIQSASATHDRPFRLAEIDSLAADCQPGQWTAAVGVLEQELRRAVKFGFSDAEFNEAKAMLLASTQADADQAATQRPRELADQIIGALAHRQVFTSLADDLTLLKNVLDDLKKTDCERVLRETWNSPERRIWVQGNLQLAGNSEEQILAAYRHSQQTSVSARDMQATGRWAYNDFGPAGRIASRLDQRDLDLVQAVLGNQVRVNVKRTHYEKNNVCVIVRFGGGLLEVPANKPGLTLLANATFINGGLQAHSLTELNQIIAGKNVSVRFAVAEDAFQLGGNCSPEMLETQLQLCAAFLTAPGYRPEARAQLLQGLEGLYAQTEHTPEGIVSDRLFAFLRSDDARFSLAPREDMQRLTLDDLRTWLAKPLKSGYLEVTIIGDVDPEVALAAVAKTFGPLPERDAAKPEFAKQRALRFPTDVKSKEFPFSSATPRALAVVCWPTRGGRDISQDRRMNVLGSVLNDRLRIKVRQELGATYTPEVAKYSSDAFPDYGYLAATITVEPEQLAEINRRVVSIAADLAVGGISDDEFNRAIKPMLSSLDDLDNSYWVNALSDCQQHPEFLTAARNRKADYQAITKADVEALAKQFLLADQATVMSVMPTAAGKEAAK